MPAKIHDEVMAAILAEASLYGDQAVAERWGVSVRTIGNYRKRESIDVTFASICLHKRTQLAEGWVPNATQCLNAALFELKKRYSSAKTREDADCINAISNSLKNVGELKLAFEALSPQSPES